MKKRKLGKYGPELSEIGLGAWVFGGRGPWSWGPADDHESIDTIHRAIDLGINWIDTAPAYGLGHSEEIVGKAIKAKRDDVYIATKCGVVWNKKTKVRHDLSPHSIRSEVEGSLARLGVETIDLYQIHWPDPNMPIEKSWREMARLQKEGKVRWLGVSNFDIDLLERCEKIHHIDSLQPLYSLLRRDVEKGVLDFCSRNGIGVVAYSPLSSGLLTGRFDRQKIAPDDWRAKSPNFQEPLLSKYLSFVERLRPIAQKYDKTVGQLAISWVLRNPAITAAIVGARRVSQIEENVSASGWQIEKGDMIQIEDLLRELAIIQPTKHTK
jgi:aryl-alcohol dehydrogenase-like predicted oxidoreductase